MIPLELNCSTAEAALAWAGQQNPGNWIEHSRFVDVTIRYGVHPATIDRWKKTLALKNLFEKRIGGSVYTLLPGVLENSFSLEVTG